MYRVVAPFADAQDGEHIYKVGDVFPRPGKEVSKERLEELASDRNKRGVALIVDDAPTEGLSGAKEDTGEAEAGVDPPRAPRAERKPRKG